MSLLSFYGAESGDPNTFFTGTGGGATVVAALRGTGSSWTGGSWAKAITPSAHVFFGVLQMSAGMDTLARLMLSIWGDGGATEHLRINTNSARVYVTRGGTEIATANYGTTANVAAYYEVEATISDTVGIVKVKVNGVTLIDFVGDTKNAGTSTNIDMISSASGGYLCTYDDLYICNDLGSAPQNTFLGDVRVVAIRPTGPGNTTGFTPDSGANWSRVNESPPSAANYVAATAAAKDTYAMADLAATPVVNVLGVRTWCLAKNPDGGACQIRNVLRSGGTDYVGATVPLGGFDIGISTFYEKNPATSALWTPAEVNGIEVGVERV